MQEEEDDRPRIAVVGKPNVGKSSIINKLLGENRVIVSDVAGTTRDAIDTEVVWDGREYIFIDTAGLRRKNKVKRGTGALQYHSYCDSGGQGGCGGGGHRCHRGSDGAGRQDRRHCP